MGNFFCNLAYVLIAPMILGRCGNNEFIFASVQSMGAVGGIAGAILMSVWGGPKPIIHGVLLSWALSGLIGELFLGFGQSQMFWFAGSFFVGFFNPILNGSNQSIWQSKVPPHLQGRVFTVRRSIAQLLSPLSIFIAGPLADHIFEPAMMKGGVLAPIFGHFIGTGKGSGIAFLFVLSGMMVAVIGFSGYLIHYVRKVELIIPDHPLVQTEN